MDLSKLPKLSNMQGVQPASESQDSQVEPAPTEPIPQSTPPVNVALSAGFGEVWISIGIGAFLLFWQPRFLQWLSSRLFHTHFDEFMLDGNVVPYQTLPVFWSDLGPALFGFVLIIDGLLLFARRRILIWAAFGLTVITTAFNLFWVIGSYAKYGLAPISFLAVIIGGFIAATQWRLLQVTPNSRA